MFDPDLNFIRWIYKRDGTVWKQLYNEEPVLTDERWEGTVEGKASSSIEKPAPGVTKPTFKQLTCKRCNASWTPRKKKKPVQCPQCKNPYWNRERMKK